MPNNTTSTFLGMHPVLAVKDLAKDLDYYQQQLEFSLSWQWGEPASRAGVRRDGIEIQLVNKLLTYNSHGEWDDLSDSHRTTSCHSLDQ
jgi:hypothetical protein